MHRDCRRDTLPNNGKAVLLEVAGVARRWINQQYSNQPVVAYGHSMGAFVVMTAIKDLPQTAGVILTGSTCEPSWLLAIKSAALRFFIVYQCVIASVIGPCYYVCTIGLGN